MSLFAEWVDRGRLRLAIKRPSFIYMPYFVLYIIAYELASEALYNEIMNEIIAISESRGYHIPTPRGARTILHLADEAPPAPLKELLVQFYGGTRDLDSLECYLSVGEDWTGLEILEHDLLHLVTKRAQGDNSGNRFPSKKTRRHFHNHPETQTCTRK